MSVVTFWNSEKEETGKTMEIIAVSTYLAIEHNYKILIISTTERKNDVIKTSFWQEKKPKKNLGIFGPNRNVDMQSGISGLVRVARSNKISPEIITNYAKIVFKDRLEVLLGKDGDELEVEDLYPQIINMANKYYDLVIVDLDDNVPKDIREEIIKDSDLIVVNMSQRLKSINNFSELREENPLYKSNKVLISMGKYDRHSKYNCKNISRYLGEKKDILTIPYNTLFFEASEEAKVPDFFLRVRKVDPEDRNSFFLQEVKRASENIIYRLQDLQSKM